MNEKTPQEKKDEMVQMQLNILEDHCSLLQEQLEYAEFHHVRDAYLYLDFIQSLGVERNADIIEMIWKRHGYDQVHVDLEEVLITGLQPEWNQPSEVPLEGELEFIHYEKQVGIDVTFYEGHVLEDPKEDYWHDDDDDMITAFAKRLEPLLKEIDYHYVLGDAVVDYEGGFMREVPNEND